MGKRSLEISDKALQVIRDKWNGEGYVVVRRVGEGERLATPPSWRAAPRKMRRGTRLWPRMG